MMVLFFLTLISSLAIYSVVLPMREYYRIKNEKDFKMKLRFLKIWAVKKYYPELSEFSLEEINEMYDIESAFQNIGRNY